VIWHVALVVALVVLPMVVLGAGLVCAAHIPVVRVLTGAVPPNPKPPDRPGW
jgi:hypothetical protein